ncbi:MAG: 1,4-dihydroxy-2-naphthoate octaprenyltransferase [Chlamydiae bacterium]|nr:1,4-dihydroxy-2-naphthoate octaprenyltransferase [Chlamydiota bacterium]
MNIWIEAARPKTLIASISPVLLGTVIALDSKALRLSVFLATLIFALCVQVGSNFANDYIDFLKGADTEERRGPRRLVQSGLVSVHKMRLVTLGIFCLAGMIGLYLMQIGGWQIGAVVLLSILLGYYYTGGPYPLGYLGLGDLFVLIFFGPVATAATTYLQTGTISSIAIIAGLAPGLLSTAILAMNNLRDVEQDRKVNKKTLPVRFGVGFGRWETVACLLLPSLIPFYLFRLTHTHLLSLTSMGYLALAIPLTRALFSDRELALLFPKAGKILTLYTILFILGWAIS